MEALRSSKAVCPFLRKTSPSQLRLLSSASAPSGVASRLQNYGQKCPVMGPALAVQGSRMSHAAVMKTALGTARAYHSASKTSKANLHTGNANKAQAVDVNILRPESGEWNIIPSLCCINETNTIQHPTQKLTAHRSKRLRITVTREVLRLVRTYPNSIMSSSTLRSSTRNTRIGHTAILTTSIVSRRNFPVPTWLKQRSALRSGAPMIT